jgi:DNA-binding Lrp family transcriptional regulator
MSTFASTWAWKQHVRPAARKFVLLALAEFADAEGACRVSQAELAEMTDQSKRSVLTHLAELETEGLITREKTRDEDGYRDLDVIYLVAAKVPRQRRQKAVRDDVQPDLGESLACSEILGEEFSLRPGSLGEKFSPQGTSFIPIEIKDVPNNTTAITEAMRASLPETDGGAGTPNIEHRTPDQTPDGAASGEAIQASSSQVLSKNALQDGGNINVKPSVSVPPPAATPFRAALNAIEAAGLTPTWLQWIRSNALRQVAQEAQAAVWQEWIEAGHAAPLKANVLDLVQSGGSFSHPWGALKARMLKAATAPLAPAQIPFKPGHRVRYEDGTEALVLDVRARGVTTDHPLYPDVPLSRLKTLELVR